MKDVAENGEINWSHFSEVHLTGKKAPNFLQKDDILISARGKHFTVSFFKQTPEQQLVCAPYFYILRLKPIYQSVILPAFLAWQLKQLPAQDYFIQHAEGSITKSIRRKTLELTPCFITSKHHQASILALDKKIEEEQQTYRELIDNSKQIMHQIAFDLLNDSTLL
ncbi:restriction endonuclease subunit S [Aliikangiella sp. GXAS 306]